MATITFSPYPRGNAITIEAGGEIGRKLLAVARDHGVPILFNCAGGACGACMVEITCLPGAEHVAAPLSKEETLLLHAMGKLPPAKGASIGTAGTGATFRLACEYIVPDANIVVRYPTGFGSQ